MTKALKTAVILGALVFECLPSSAQTPAINYSIAAGGGTRGPADSGSNGDSGTSPSSKLGVANWSVTTPADQAHGSATATGSAMFDGDFGRIGVSVAASAAVLPGAFGQNANSYGTATATFIDRLTVLSDSLALSSPVTVHVQFTIEGATSADIGPGIDSVAKIFPQFNVNGLHPVVPGTINLTPNQSISLMYELDYPTFVGQTFSVAAGIGVFTQLWAGTTTFNGVVTGHSGESKADFSHTARVFADVVGGGAYLSSVSGHDYSVSSVPEPSAAMLILAGLLPLIGLIRWRRDTLLRG